MKHTKDNAYLKIAAVLKVCKELKKTGTKYIPVSLLRTLAEVVEKAERRKNAKPKTQTKTDTQSLAQ